MEIRIFTDTGHLVTNPWWEILTPEARIFVKQKSKKYLLKATDKESRGSMYYILKPGLKEKWTYKSKDGEITLIYDVDSFNYKTMRYLD
jgi:hypothetical protein